MSLKIYNSFTHRKEEFQPLDPERVKMYVCGITPYDETHLGHGRAYITFDIVRRWLEKSGYAVTYVQNFTDIDDKIIAKAEKEGRKASEVAAQYIASYFEVMDRLNVKRADNYPKATEHIEEMISWIAGLLKNGSAYILPDGVYFSVESFASYGQLSGRKLEDNEAGARVAVMAGKKNPFDFVLWKLAKQGEPCWPSPWGEGRPGWHIECSVMSTKYLGEQFDIHGGGLDLEFPHHENEIAQTEALTGKKPWVKYWLHNGFVNVNKQKMSKSLGNFFTLKDIFQKYDPLVVRFFILQTHYRSPINYSDAQLDNAKEAYARLNRFVADVDFLVTHSVSPLSQLTPQPPLLVREGENLGVEKDRPSLYKRGERGEFLKSESVDLADQLALFRDKFDQAMDDDFNTAGALAAAFEMVKYCRKTIDEGERGKNCLLLMKKTLQELLAILGLKLDPAKVAGPKPEEIERLIAERQAARQNKNFPRADQIRRELAEQGIILEDSPEGTRWQAAV